MKFQTSIAITTILFSAFWPSSLFTTSSESHSSTAVNLSGYCERKPSCICIKGRAKSTVHCNKVLDIMSEMQSFFPISRHERGKGIRNQVSAHCNQSISRDMLEDLSLMEIDKEIELSLKISNCPLPDHSYASLFHSHDGQVINVPFYALIIECGQIDHFDITSDHLVGLQELNMLAISCRALKVLPKDLLQYIPKAISRLYISDTSIEAIPDNFFHNYSSLKILNLSSNKLTHIYKNTFLGLGDMQGDIFLDYNSIQQLDDDAFLTVQKIAGLDISHNKISILPRSIQKLSNLMSLKASNNIFTQIDATYFSGCHSLHVIYFNENRLAKLDPIIFHSFVNATSIEFGNNSLGATTPPSVSYDSENRIARITSATESSQNDSMSLPEDLFSKNLFLGRLNLKENSLRYLPEKLFFYNKELGFLNLSCNRLTNLPKGLFEKNKMLKILDLSRNEITELPDGIFVSQIRLEKLTLSENKIKYLGKDIFVSLVNIEEIYLNGNLLEKLHIDIFSSFKTKPLKLLYLQDNLLSSLPNMTLPSVEHLRLERNQIVSIGKNAFSNMTSLSSIDCSNNHIEDIQDGAFFIESRRLRSINLANNKLTSISDKWFKKSLDKLPTLYLSLNFSGNSVSQINFTLEMQFTVFRTEILDLSRNNLTHFGEYTDHGRLIQESMGLKIRQLDLSHNRIRSVNSAHNFDYIRKTWGLTSGFEEYYLLEVLNLAHNELKAIPMDWRNSLPRLRLLDLSHNRIKHLWHQDLLFSTGNVMGLQTTPYKPTSLEANWTFDEYPCTLKLTVDLRHNLIERIELPVSLIRKVPNECKKDRHYSHATLLLGHNPFLCDCQIFNILRYAAKEIRPVAELEMTEGKNLVRPAQIDLEGLACSEPLSVRGKHLSEPETWMYHILPLKGICTLIDDM